MGSEAQVAFMTQKISQLEKELVDKDAKWKSTSGEKEAELIKKLSDYKEKVIPNNTINVIDPQARRNSI